MTELSAVIYSKKDYMFKDYKERCFTRGKYIRAPRGNSWTFM